MIFRQSILLMLYFFVISAFYQCQSVAVKKEDALERNLIRAGKNRAELEKVLQHYQNDSLKRQAAILLISNMERSYDYQSDWLDQFNMIFDQIQPLSETEIASVKDSLLAVIGTQAQNTQQQDLQTLSADYLIANIDDAFASWQAAPWRDSVSFDLFCNYILPYKSFNEVAEPWRAELHNRYKSIANNPFYNHTSAEVACEVNDDLKTWFRYSDQFNDYPGRIRISYLLKGQHGNCSDMANLATYTMRSVGIPVAIDYTPQWGNYHDGHVWNALILNENSALYFLGGEANPGEYRVLQEGESKIAKAFRRTLVIQDSSLAAKAAKMGETDLPIYLQNPRSLDVTPLYTAAYTVKMHLQNHRLPLVYLCIAKREKWEAIAGAAIDAQGNAAFPNMGHNVLYNPMFYKNGTYTPAGAPFIITYEGKLHTLNADLEATKSARLTRIFPLKRSDAKWTYAEYLRDSRLEAANTPDFKDAVTLYTIAHPMDLWHTGQLGGPSLRDRLDYESMWEATNIMDQKAYRYLRLVFPERQFCKVGELQFLDDNATPLAGEAIGSVQHPGWAFDGVPGFSIIDEAPEGGRWVGLDLGEPKQITQFRYLAATGEYDIQPGKTYQLFYWQNAWKSLGVQKADKHLLNFEKVPTNALFWLHCKDCGETFERPFTYENHRQIWW